MVWRWLRRMRFTMVYLLRRWLFKCGCTSRAVKVMCCLLLGVLVPFNVLFLTRGCRHTAVFLDPDRPDSFRHGNPPRLPDHYLAEVQFGRQGLKRARSLLSSPVAPLLHLLWCEDGPFQFQHYLGVLAAVKFLSPTSIIFHHASMLPEMDSDGYYQFFMDLKRDLPHMTLQSAPSLACSSDPNTRLHFLLRMLNPQGGVYVASTIVLAEALLEQRAKSFSLASIHQQVEVLMMEKGYMDNRHPLPDLDTLLQEEQESRFFCSPFTSHLLGITPCLYIDHQIYPVDIWELASNFGSLARWLTHGKTAQLKPQPANSTVIPNIVHYVWLGDRTFKYFSYLSLLSALYVLNADMVYIHGDFEPRGEHWRKIRLHQRITFVNREFPAAVFSEPIVKFASHASDYLRGDILVRYGGIYMDWDVIWVNPIPQDLLRYETVACPDFPETGAFPDVFNMGVLMAARGSAFLRFFLESYHNYLDNHWSYNAIHMPYKVYEKHPDLLKIHRKLQVICAERKCHPVWYHNFKDKAAHHLTTSHFDWQTDPLAMHWTYPDPHEFADPHSLQDSISMFAAIGKYVLRKAEHLLEKEMST